MARKLTKPKKARESLTFGVSNFKVSQHAKSHADLKEFAVNEEGRERINWAQSILRIPSIWSNTRGRGVKVAVLDTGIDDNHPDLSGAIVENKDFTGDGLGDENGHGTHCAGIVGARLNEYGFVGVAPECELLIGKVLNNSGEGHYDWIAEGIYWAVENGADIISMSLGGPNASPEIYKAIQYALFYGKSVICAAGNEGRYSGNTIGYPGKNGGVITVASHDRAGNPSGFSSRGGELDFMAPGGEIWSTYPGGGFATLSGTSMATPFVAGLAALIVANNFQDDNEIPLIANCEELKNHLLTMAAHPHEHNRVTGYGALLPFRYIW